MGPSALDSARLDPSPICRERPLISGGTQVSRPGKIIPQTRNGAPVWWVVKHCTSRKNALRSRARVSVRSGGVILLHSPANSPPCFLFAFPYGARALDHLDSLRNFQICAAANTTKPMARKPRMFMMPPAIRQGQPIGYVACKHPHAQAPRNSDVSPPPGR